MTNEVTQRPDRDDAPRREQVVSLYQKQAKIYPRSVSGRYTHWRWVLVWVKIGRAHV